MGNKNQNRFKFNWQSTAPVPAQPTQNQVLSGTTSGTMSGASTIYSNYVDLTNYDDSGIEITWTGTPTGTITYYASVSGNVFYPLSNFSPSLPQPSGSASGYLLNLALFPYKFIYIQYTNSSGSGTLTAWINEKDLN